MISSLEIAKLCGVSQGTVDRALHDRKGISEKTKEKILKVARQHGYQPNPVARELMTGKSRMVGALIPAINSVFFMDMFNEIKTELSAKGYRLMLTPVSSAEEMQEMLQEFAARRYCSVILIPPAEKIKIPPGIAANLKVIVLINPVKAVNTYFIGPDEVQTGREAVNYLYKKGHRRIVHLTYKSNFDAIKKRTQGYRERMEELKLKPLIVTDASNRKVLQALKKGQATAIFCHNDWLALSVIRGLEQNGIGVPEQVAVLGVDNSPTFTELYSDITTLDYPSSWIANQVVKILAGKYRQSKPPRCQVVERKSC